MRHGAIAKSVFEGKNAECIDEKQKKCYNEKSHAAEGKRISRERDCVRQKTANESRAYCFVIFCFQGNAFV